MSMEGSALEALLLEVRDRLARIEERMAPEPTCLRYADAAQRLGVSLTTLKRMVVAGEVRTVRVGRVSMVPLAEIHRVSTPESERPRIEARSRAATWVPIQRARR